MKKGDIVYFGEEHVATYCKVGGCGSYQYYFKPGVRYKVFAAPRCRLVNFYQLVSGITLPAFDPSRSTRYAVIQNLEDDIKHFAHSTILSKLITQDEWRDLCINKLIENI